MGFFQLEPQAVEQVPRGLDYQEALRGLFDRLRLELEKAHTYEVPEVLAVPVVEGSPNYLNWLENELGPPGV